MNCSRHIDKGLRGAVKLRWQTTRGEYKESVETLHWPQNYTSVSLYGCYMATH